MERFAPAWKYGGEKRIPHKKLWRFYNKGKAEIPGPGGGNCFGGRLAPGISVGRQELKKNGKFPKNPKHSYAFTKKRWNLPRRIDLVFEICRVVI